MPSRLTFSQSQWDLVLARFVLELIVVSTLTGVGVRRTRMRWLPLAFLMIATGFLGADTFPGSTGRLVWGLVATGFFLPLYVGLLRAGFASARELAEPAGPHVRGAALMLSWTWGVYPLAYCVPFFFAVSPGWAVAVQVSITLTDIAAKVGCGLFIHAAAKARTAIDVADGESPHPEILYVNGLRVAGARPVTAATGDDRT